MGSWLNLTVSQAIIDNSTFADQSMLGETIHIWGVAVKNSDGTRFLDALCEMSDYRGDPGDTAAKIAHADAYQKRLYRNQAAAGELRDVKEVAEEAWRATYVPVELDGETS